MERLTGRGAKSLKEAYAKVYSEQATPDYASMSDEEFAALVKKSGNPEGLMAKRKQQQQIAARENSRANYTADDARADQEKAKVEAENRRRASRGEDPLPTSQPAQSSQPTAKPPTDQQKVRAEYDRLRNSKDPKERAQAVTYGRQMAAAGAAKKDFSGYQSAADAKKNLPAPAQRTSIAQRLQAIRDMRARSQSNITAQGGKPATPAVQPKTQPAAAQPAAQPKVQPAAQPKVQSTTNPNQQSSLNNTVQSAASRALNTGSLKDKQDAMDIVNKNYASSIDKLVTDRMINNIKKPKPAVTTNQQSSASGLSARGTQAINQVRQNAQANMSSDMQARIQAMRDRRQELRNQNQGVSTGNTIKTTVNPDSSIKVTQKRSPEATAKIKKSLDI